MAISFPLTPPAAPGFNVRELMPRTAVGVAESPFTGHQQVYAWPAQFLVFSFSLPPMKDAQAGEWAAFFMALNGPEGAFYLGDSVRKTSRGTVGGSWLVGAGAAANSTTLPLKSGTGHAALGDWLQVGTGTGSRLHRVVKVNLSAGAMVSVDVFPRLRAAYAEDVAVSFANAKGIFRLVSLPGEAFDSRRICAGMSFTAREVL